MTSKITWHFLHVCEVRGPSPIGPDMPEVLPPELPPVRHRRGGIGVVSAADARAAAAAAGGCHEGMRKVGAWGRVGWRRQGRVGGVWVGI